MKKRRKIGRYIVLIIVVVFLVKHFRKPSRVWLPDLPEVQNSAKIFANQKAYPHIASSVLSISKYGIYTKNGRIILIGGGDWRLKLAIADTIISANWHFRILDLRHDSWAFLRR